MKKARTDPEDVSDDLMEELLKGLPSGRVILPTTLAKTVPTNLKLSCAVHLDKRWFAPMKKGLRLIDSVHGVDRLPVDVKVWRGRTGCPHKGRTDPEAEYCCTAEEIPEGIAIAPDARHPILAFIHEVAHYLDHQVLGEPGQFASAHHDGLQPWREAIATSQAYVNLTDSLKNSAFVCTDELASQRVKYMLEWEELWARSYVQFVVAKSRMWTLKEELGDMRRMEPKDLRGIWLDDDFWLIAEQVQNLFVSKRWMK